MSGVVNLLIRELTLLDELISLLEEEQAALKQGLLDPLTGFSEQKSQRIHDLNNLDTELRHFLGDMPIDPKVGLHNWPITLAERNVAEPIWKSLLEKGRRAKQLNTLNAQLVDLHLQNTRELLTCLVPPPTDSGPLYGCNGQADGRSGSRIIDQA